MAGSLKWLRWFRSPVNVIPAGLFLAGLLLTEISWGFLALCAVATFGPGFLREMGWLRDKDEFQRQAAHRAGYHAYLAGGFITFLLVALFRSGEHPVKDPSDLVTSILALMCFTWLLSSLLAYWGPQRTATRILIIFGSAWSAFVLLSHWNEPASGLALLKSGPSRGAEAEG